MANKNIVMLYNTDSALKVLEGLSIATVNKNKEDAVATTTIEQPSRTGCSILFFALGRVYLWDIHYRCNKT